MDAVEKTEKKPPILPAGFCEGLCGFSLPKGFVMKYEFIHGPFPLTPDKLKRPTGFVYVIRCGDFHLYKVGVTQRNPGVRLDDLQVGCPFRLILVSAIYCFDCYGIESYLHQYCRERGKCVSGEWFELTIKELVEILIFIDGHKYQMYEGNNDKQD